MGSRVGVHKLNVGDRVLPEYLLLMKQLYDGFMLNDPSLLGSGMNVLVGAFSGALGGYYLNYTGGTIPLTPNSVNQMWFEVYKEDDPATSKFDNISYGVYPYVSPATPQGDYSLHFADVITDAVGVTIILIYSWNPEITMQHSNTRWRGYQQPIFADELATKAYVDGVVGINQFIQLIDTPATYIGQARKPVRVNPGETAVEFASNIKEQLMVPHAFDFDYGAHRVHRHPKNTSENYSLHIPDDFGTLVSCHIEAIARGAEGIGWTYQNASEYGTPPEQYNNHTEAGPLHVSLAGMNAGQLFAFDISDVLTGVGAGDNVGIEITTGSQNDDFLTKYAHIRYIPV
jgi:hypothetical protein